MNATPAFLTDDEVRRLTGRAWKHKQAEWLRQNRIPFYLNALGRPIVSRSVIEATTSRVDAAPALAWHPTVIG